MNPQAPKNISAKLLQWAIAALLLLASPIVGAQEGRSFHLQKGSQTEQLVPKSLQAEDYAHFLISPGATDCGHYYYINSTLIFNQLQRVFEKVNSNNSLKIIPVQKLLITVMSTSNSDEYYFPLG